MIDPRIRLHCPMLVLKLAFMIYFWCVQAIRNLNIKIHQDARSGQALDSKFDEKSILDMQTGIAYKLS